MIDSWKIGDFDDLPFQQRWVPWGEFEAAAYPGRRLAEGHASFALRSVLFQAGIYFIARSESGQRPSGMPRADHKALTYIGETGQLLRRLKQFADSAGFWGQRYNGHSGAFNWPLEWPKQQAFVAVFPVPPAVIEVGLTPLWRICREAQAMATYARRHSNRLPLCNAKGANDRDDAVDAESVT